MVFSSSKTRKPIKKQTKNLTFTAIYHSVETNYSMLGAADFLCYNYLGCCDSAVDVISRKSQVFQIFSHLDTEGVVVHCLKVQSLWTKKYKSKSTRIWSIWAPRNRTNQSESLESDGSQLNYWLEKALNSHQVTLTSLHAVLKPAGSPVFRQETQWTFFYFFLQALKCICGNNPHLWDLIISMWRNTLFLSCLNICTS